MGKSDIQNAIEKASKFSYTPDNNSLDFDITTTTLPIGFLQGGVDRILDISNPSTTLIVWLGFDGDDAVVGFGLAVMPLTTLTVPQMQGGRVEAISSDDVTIGVQIWERDITA